MWHRLNDVAFHRFLDPVKFARYANDCRKDIIEDNEVSSWHVDELVKSYREFIGAEEAERDRIAIITASMGKL